MSVRKNSRSFQLRKAAEREQARYQQQLPEGFRFREVLAFMQGADWERRRWKKYYWQTPEMIVRDYNKQLMAFEVEARFVTVNPSSAALRRPAVCNGFFPSGAKDGDICSRCSNPRMAHQSTTLDKYPDPEHPTGTALKAGAS